MTDRERVEQGPTTAAERIARAAASAVELVRDARADGLFRRAQRALDDAALTPEEQLTAMRSRGVRGGASPPGSSPGGPAGGAVAPGDRGTTDRLNAEIDAAIQDRHACPNPIRLTRVLRCGVTGAIVGREPVSVPCGMKTCEKCAARMSRALIAHYINAFEDAGEGTLWFLTLTLDFRKVRVPPEDRPDAPVAEWVPLVVGGPDDETEDYIKHSFGKLRKRLNRRAGKRQLAALRARLEASMHDPAVMDTLPLDIGGVEYVGTVERTQVGAAHLHVLMRAHVLEHEIREAWRACSGAPVLDVQPVDGWDYTGDGDRRAHLSRKLGYILKYAFKRTQGEGGRLLLASQGLGYHSAKARAARRQHLVDAGELPPDPVETEVRRRLCDMIQDGRTPTPEDVANVREAVERERAAPRDEAAREAARRVLQLGLLDARRNRLPMWLVTEGIPVDILELASERVADEFSAVTRSDGTVDPWAFAARRIITDPADLDPHELVLVRPVFDGGAERVVSWTALQHPDIQRFPRLLEAEWLTPWGRRRKVEEEDGDDDPISVQRRRKRYARFARADTRLCTTEYVRWIGRGRERRGELHRFDPVTGAWSCTPLPASYRNPDLAGDDEPPVDLAVIVADLDYGGPPL